MGLNDFEGNKNHKNIELLAPAGSFESFLAAVENGADAVYCGLNDFSARAFASNFSMEELKKALDYAHVRDVSVYVTMNTLINDGEMERALNIAIEAYNAGVDAIIVQDIGFAIKLKQIIPGVCLHGSTQMTVYNSAGARMLENIGFKRVVLARECSVEEVLAIKKDSEIELEVFVHGALCVCYSGQCLMSSMIGRRSGNRGKCAQPCRLGYELLKGDRPVGSGYLLSTKDLCTIENIGGIIDTGVVSLKIEGRMKSPQYVGTVVGTYRKMVDMAMGRGLGLEVDAGKDIEKDIGKDIGKGIVKDIVKDARRRLLYAFNRGGFTSGYLGNKKGADIVYTLYPGNMGVHIGTVINYDRKSDVLKVRLEEDVSVGDYIEIRENVSGKQGGEFKDAPGFTVSEILVGKSRGDEAERGQDVFLGRIMGNSNNSNGFYNSNNSFEGQLLYKTFDIRLNEEIKESYSGKVVRKLPVDFEVWVLKDKPLKIVARQGDFEGVYESSVVPEIAVNRAISEGKIIEQIVKTGNTPFAARYVVISLDEGITLPISSLNEARREVLRLIEVRKISEAIGGREVASVSDFVSSGSAERKLMGKSKLSIQLFVVEEGVSESLAGVERVYLPVWALLDKDLKMVREIKRVRKSCGEVYLWLPAVSKGTWDDRYLEIVDKCKEYELDGIMAGNIGQIEMYAGKIDRVQGGFAYICVDYSMNVYNSATLEFLKNFNVSSATVSVEFNYHQIRNIRHSMGLDIEMIVYGKLPVMISEHCPLRDLGCGNKVSEFKIRDRMGKKMDIFRDCASCRAYIFNSDTLVLIDEWNKIRDLGIDYLRIVVNNESVEEISKIVGVHKGIIAGKIDVNNNAFLEGIKGRGFTRGHFTRGV